MKWSLLGFYSACFNQDRAPVFSISVYVASYCQIILPETAVSNMAVIMGREAAYTGTEITWDAMTASPLDYTPKDLNLGKMDMTGFTVPVPGKPRDEKKK